jgi:hypothetical protein
MKYGQNVATASETVRRQALRNHFLKSTPVLHGIITFVEHRRRYHAKPLVFEARKSSGLVLYRRRCSEKVMIPRDTGIDVQKK